MSLLEELPHRCTIQKRSVEKTTLGGSDASRTPVSTNVECWEQAASDSEMKRFAQQGMVITRKVYFNEDPGIKKRFEIVITQRNGVAVATDNQVALEVKSVAGPDAGAGLGVLYRVMCEEVTAENN